MESTRKRIIIFYGSQTGTAEEYALKIAKELKHKYGLGVIIADLDDYDFDSFSKFNQDWAAVFVMATYGEGEPTDNAVAFMEFLDSPELEDGAESIPNLQYLVFGLGNRTYTEFNGTARKMDAKLQVLGARRIGERGEGDDNKSMEEDYLAWKDGAFEALAKTLNVEEGNAAQEPDFRVTEITDIPEEKVYLGELSARALHGTKGIHDVKNPYAAPIIKADDLFKVGTDRSCVQVELSTEGSNINYQHGDHVGLWPVNAEVYVENTLNILGLGNKRQTIIQIESLDPALAKVPFPQPTTYESAFRHYLDISVVVSRQTLALFAKHAPNEQAKKVLTELGTNKDKYKEVVSDHSMKLFEVLEYAAKETWKIPFDDIVSSIPRLQPRYYSISSSPKLNPNSIHITAVVLQYKSVGNSNKNVYGLATNYVLNIKQSIKNENIAYSAPVDAQLVAPPKYAIQGPRGAYTRDGGFKVPIHVRRSNFRLPNSPKIPIIAIGPGTGVAPFRGFVQERVHLARRYKEKKGEEALNDWGKFYLFYGCRKGDEDYLYKDEWPEYGKELGDTFVMKTAISREGDKKVYVQDHIWEARQELADAILEKRAYIYICGDASNMARQVEETLQRILGEARGGTMENEGAQEIRLLKERNRIIYHFNTFHFYIFTLTISSSLFTTIMSSTIDASQILAEHSKKYKPTQISREIPIENDLNLLTAFDTNAINADELKSNRENYVKELSRDSVQNLINDLFNQPITKTLDGPLAKLPEESVYQLPREKPLPKPKALTKWQKFANEKGISHKKKDRMVFDEDEQKWVPRWGYNGINKKEENQWLHELKEGQDEDHNPASAIKGARKERSLKNVKQQLKNEGITKSIQEKQKAEAAAKRAERAQHKQELEKSLHRSKISTASLGKFDKKLSGEPTLKGQKRKFNPVTNTSDEHKSNREILDKVATGAGKLNKSTGSGSKDLVNTRRAINSTKKSKK
ncbi:NADPH-dependent cytochrome P450 oxidoreductase [Wallemia mellicola]|nr:NADPH-dependent cytochrome P450 oxidoreductase [Wallemia mellicola]